MAQAAEALMRRYLVLTTVDVLARANNREHQILAHLAPRFEKTVVVYRRRCPKGSWRQVLADALIPRARRIERDGVTYVEVNPLLNHFEGMAGEAAGYQDFAGAPAARRSLLRQWLFVAISGLGIFKDVSTILCLAFFAWRACSERFDVATALGPWGAVAGLILRTVGCIDCLIYEDRDYEPGFIRTPLRRRWAGWLERFAMRRADEVITIGQRLAQLRHDQTGRRIILVPTGVEISRFACPERDRPQPVLIYTGNIAPWSGLDLVLQAVSHLREVIPAIRCVFVGSGLPQFRKHLEALISTYGLQDAVRLTGQVPYEDVRAYLAQASIGLALFQPNELRRYAAPLKVLEYMAAGLPTIATAESEAADLVTREACGVGVEFSAEAFTNAVLEILQDDESYHHMSIHAQRAAEKYNWSFLMATEYSVIGDAYNRRAAKLRPAS
ncbi:MAG TPA: glycosyltransferase family 4 protein [Dongiaceae bacterium]|nr:glycosyltransferase family 4 protein [Dongiaceae bacterium]